MGLQSIRKHTVPAGYILEQISAFVFAIVERKLTADLFLLAQMYLLSVIETGTKTQWDIPKQTLSILKCFSSLKQIDFFLLYHLPIFKAGKGQHIGSCYLPMFVADSPLKLVRAAADARFWVQCLHSAWSWEREPSPPVKAFTEFSFLWDSSLRHAIKNHQLGVLPSADSVPTGGSCFPGPLQSPSTLPQKDI